MAGVKISALPAVSSALLTDFLPVVQGGVTSQETLLQIRTLYGFNSGTGLLSLANGGTNANLTAALGAIPYSTATALALLAPGTTGQFLSSGGAGAPVWTTATFPVTAGASGNVLVSNGTNWTSGTATGVTALGAQAQALNMNSHLINNVTDPVSPQDAATKNYVDTIAAGGGAPVVAASTTSLTVTYSNGVAGVGATLTNAGAQATFALDGQNPIVGQRVLIKDQSGGSNVQNGVYIVTNVGSGATNWVLTRATDYDTPSNINDTGIIPVSAGTVNANTGWINTTLMVTVGITAVTFIQFGVSFPVSLANGGTNASLTASINSLVVGTASAMAFLATQNSSSLLTNGSGVPGWVTNIGTGSPPLYNETSWTPTITFGGASVGVTYSVQTGNYAQIGNLIYFYFIIELSAVGSSTGAAAVGGLPFNSSTGNEVISVGTVQNATIHNNNMYGNVLTSGNQMLLKFNASGGTGSNYANTDFTNTSIIIGEGFYFIA